MEDIININEYVRTDNGIIGKYVKYRGIEDTIETNNKWIGFDIEKDIVKHSSNLIDLIECGDYVNGYIVRRTYLDGETHYIKLGEQITGNRTYNDDIKTVVTKEMMESISYKVTKM